MVKNFALAAIVAMFATATFAETKKDEMPAKDDAATPASATAPEKDAKMDEKEAKK